MLVFIFDAHNDTLLKLLETSVEERDFMSNAGRHVSLSKVQQAGISAQIFAIFVPPQSKAGLTLHTALKMVEIFWETVEAYPDSLGVVQSSEDFEHLMTTGKIACMLSLEGGDPLLGELSHLRLFYRLGVRALTLTWNHRNELADGVGEGRTALGISRFGRLVIHEMNHLGMIIDVSHLAEKGFWDVLTLSEDPVMASHSNARSLCNHPRNLSDAQIRAIANKGGVIGVNFYPGFLCAQSNGDASIDMVVEQISYLLKIGGCDCVGLGSDFDGIASTPLGLEDIATVPRLIPKLVAKGYSEAVVEKVMGKNFLRLVKSVLHFRAY